MLAREARDPLFLTRILITVCVLFLLIPTLRISEFNPTIFFDANAQQVVANFVSGFFPPELSLSFLEIVAKATLETLAIATVGTTLALVIAIPLALIVARSLSISRLGPANKAWLSNLVRVPTRALLIVLRSVPEIVWALLFVRAVGLGPVAGIFAIAISYSGMLGKVYSEILETNGNREANALLVAGSGRCAAFCYGTLPAAIGELMSYTVYRWECAIRASVIMGFVGAGGLGQQMELSLRMLNGHEVATILLVFLLLVWLADMVSAILRRVFA